MARPRDVVLRAPVLLAALALALNDHVLKALAPGVVTGKLSDVAGLFALPLVAWAALDLLSPRRATTTALAALAGLTAAAFAAIKALEPARRLWVDLHALAGLPVRVAPDLTDLLCLPCAALAWAYGARHQRSASPPAQLPWLAGAARVAVVLAFVVLTTATSVGPPRQPVGARVLTVAGDEAGLMRVDSRAYSDRPFEVLLPPGPWRRATVTVQELVEWHDPAALPPALPVQERTLLETTDPALLAADPVILAFPALDRSRAGRRSTVPAAEAPRYATSRVEVRAEHADGRALVLVLQLEEEWPGEGDGR